jgi:hypothetical protein
MDRGIVDSCVHGGRLIRCDGTRGTIMGKVGIVKGGQFLLK